MSRLAPLEPHTLAYDQQLCASLDGFTLHAAATRAGALHPAGREALLRYLLRSPVAQERVEQRPSGLVRITLKKAYQRASKAPAHHPLRGRAGSGEPVEVAPRAASAPPSPAASDEPDRPDLAGGYRPWAELLARTFAVDVLACPTCQGG